jgi:hypothetical protein
MSIAHSVWQDNPSSAPAGTPQHTQYWQQRLIIESVRASRARWPPNPTLSAGVRAYWERLFNEGNNGSSTETT